MQLKKKSLQVMWLIMININNFQFLFFLKLNKRLKIVKNIEKKILKFVFFKKIYYFF